MTKYIIIWAILQSGPVMYANPEYNHVFANEDNLANSILDIQKKAFSVDVKVYRVEEIQWEMKTKVVDIQVEDIVVDSFKIIDSKKLD